MALQAPKEVFDELLTQAEKSGKEYMIPDQLKRMSLNKKLKER